MLLCFRPFSLQKFTLILDMEQIANRVSGDYFLGQRVQRASPPPHQFCLTNNGISPAPVLALALALALAGGASVPGAPVPRWR